MSLVLRGLDLSMPQTSSGVVHQQNSSEWLDIARQQGSSLIDYSVEGNRLYERADGSIGLAEKPIGYVIGEQVVRPSIDAISSVWNSCAMNTVWGAAGSLITRNPAPLVVSSLSCVDKVEARDNSYQGEVVLQPGKKFYSEGNRKLAICKNGRTAWDDDASCNYHGPAMKVTVMRYDNINKKQDVLYHGPYQGSHQWGSNHKENKLTITIENTSQQSSAMYVHMENFGNDDACTIL